MNGFIQFSGMSEDAQAFLNRPSLRALRMQESVFKETGLMG
jgi:hypothetical protein